MEPRSLMSIPTVAITITWKAVRAKYWSPSKYSACLEEGLDTGVLPWKVYLKKGHRKDYYQVEDQRFLGA